MYWQDAMVSAQSQSKWMMRMERMASTLAESWGDAGTTAVIGHAIRTRGSCLTASGQAQHLPSTLTATDC